MIIAPNPINYRDIRHMFAREGLLSMLRGRLAWTHTIFKYTHSIGEHKRLLRRMKKTYRSIKRIERNVQMTSNRLVSLS